MENHIKMDDLGGKPVQHPYMETISWPSVVDSWMEKTPMSRSLDFFPVI